MDLQFSDIIEIPPVGQFAEEVSYACFHPNRPSLSIATGNQILSMCTLSFKTCFAIAKPLHALSCFYFLLTLHYSNGLCVVYNLVTRSWSGKLIAPEGGKISRIMHVVVQPYLVAFTEVCLQFANYNSYVVEQTV